MIGTIVGLLVIGLVAGFIARAVVPGRQAMGIGQTILLDIYLMATSRSSSSSGAPAGETRG